MFAAPPPPTLAFGAVLAEIGGAEAVAAVVGLGVIAMLAWQLWRSQRDYALEVEEHAQLVAEEREQAAQLRQQLEARTKESQAKNEMLATLSREVRAHLNGIIGSADLLLDNSLSVPQREHLTTLRASAESLHQSLNDVLEFSSIEMGQITINRAPFDLRQPLVEVVEHLSPLALLKELELVLIVAPEVPVQVAGDAARLHQVLLNLTSNAVKFTTQGRVVLRVELSSGSSAPSRQGASWLHFSVSDTSPGVPEEMLARIFERFERTDPSSPRKFGGSGLELAISKRLVELMGGQIGVRNLPESGTEFWAVLPLGIEQPGAPVAPRTAFHVVVLDDLAAARIAASAMLARLGVEHDSTDNVTEAAGLLRDAREGGATELALLLDQSVSNGNAREIVRLVTQDNAISDTRIVLMSREPELTAAAGHEFPVTAVVSKPLLRADALLEALLKKPAKPAARPTPSRAPFETAAPTRTEPRVLIVDDDEISRSVTAQLLARLGCLVERAVSGTDAIECARRMRFDLIFMDCQMPEMDGFETTTRIRANAGSKPPPIVALTANTSPADREKCFSVGMCDFVDKPVRRSELARVVKRWVPAATGKAT